MVYNLLVTDGYLIPGEVERVTSKLCEKVEYLEDKARVLQEVIS